jgi:hypothetical protein
MAATNPFPGPFVGAPPGSALFTEIHSATNTLVKTGIGSLRAIHVNTSTASTLTIYDGTSSGGTLIATLTTAAPFYAPYAVQFNTGLYITSSGTASVTVCWS